MEDILLYLDEERILRFKFFTAIHPSLVHVKADHWKFIYKLYHEGNQVLPDKLFTGNYLIAEHPRLIILEEYDVSILDSKVINTDEDVKLHLRLVDFSANKTGVFSKLTGGSFLLQNVIGNKLVYSKQYPDKTIEYEIDMAAIKLEEMPEGQ